MNLLAAVGEVIAPPRCLNCLIENTWLCHPCAASLPTHNHPHKTQSPLAGLTSAGLYGHPAYKRLVGWLKFKGVRSLAPLAAALIADSLLTIAPLTTLQHQALLIPIPLHPHKARQRGFNQTLEITKAIHEQTAIPFTNILIRHQSTWTQSQLPHNLRQENVRQAFTLKSSPPSKKYLLLIDDVSTTGSTLQAAAATLDPHTNAAIWGCVVAQG